MDSTLGPASDPAESTLRGETQTHASIEALLQRHYVGLWRLISRSAGSATLGADLLHDAIVVALRKIASAELREPDEIAGYVYRTALNLLRNHKRNYDNRPERQAAPDSLPLVASSGAGPEEQIDAGIAGEVHRVMCELRSERDRILLKRFYLDEEDKETICRDMRLNPLQFDKVMFRARQRMREMLGEQGFKRNDFFMALFGCFPG